MADSLTIDGQIETIGNLTPSTLPGCSGAVFILDDTEDDFTLGVPAPIADIVATLGRDGEVPTGQRTSDRSPVLPINIIAPSRDIMVAARETILKIVDKELWSLTWTREGGQPMVLDCFRQGQPDITYKPLVEKQFCCQIVLHFMALPFGHSDTQNNLAFQTAVVGATPPPTPIELDTAEVLAGGNAGWTLSNSSIEGSHSVTNQTVPYGTGGLSGGATYTSAAFAAKNITGLTQLSFYAGFQTVPATGFFGYYYGQNYFASYPNVSFNITLYDSHGATLTFGETDNNLNSGINGPVWSNITVTIPQNNTIFDYTSVVKYTVNMVNYLGRNFVGAYPFIDAVWASNQTTAFPTSQRGNVYQIVNIEGSARAPLGLTVQQTPQTIPITVLFHASGNWTAPYGVTQVDISGTGVGGLGSNRSTSGSGGGGGAGGWSREPTAQVTGGKIYAFTIPLPSTTPGVSPGDITMVLDNVTLTVHSGQSAPANSATGALGGLASGNTQSFRGGNGFTTTAPGGGGGSPATSSGAGHDATGQAGATAQTGGVAGGSGGAAGNNPGGAAPGFGAGSGGAVSTGTAEPGGTAGQGTLSITYVGMLTPFNMAILHIPGPTSSPTLTPYVPIPSPGAPGTMVPVQSQIAGFNARFNSTYTCAVVAAAGVWDSPGAQRTITFNVFEWEYAGAATYSSVQSVSKTFTPNASFPDGAPNGYVPIGELTLPNREIPIDNVNMYYTIRIDDTNGNDRFMDAIFLDTMGQTVIINEPTLSYAQYFMLIPDSSRDDGQILGSVTDLTRAASVSDNTWMSGGPLLVYPDVVNSLFVYSTLAAPAVEAWYYPQWWVDRILG